MDKYTAIVVMTCVIGGTVMLGGLLQSIVKIVTGRQKAVAANTALAGIEERLVRIEQAIDAMAVEVERVSEGQRFTSKLLSERAGDRVEERSRL